ncbi:hypothetical protein D9M68_572970 [compost metagenome]
MNTRRNLLLGAGVAAAGLAALGAGLVGRDWALPEPEYAAGDSFGARYFPNVTLYTHEGRRVKLYDDLVRDKVVAFNMMYTLCGGLCPTMTANLRGTQKLLGERAGRDVFMYSITLQPELDTPEILREYAESHHVGPGWLFLTGDPADLDKLRRKLGFFDPDPEIDADRTTHIRMVRIGNDRFDQWTMASARSDPRQLVSAINMVDRSVDFTSYNGRDASLPA